jgi:hypothetical protein
MTMSEKKPARPALYGVDSRIIACRGDHHDWPQLLPGKVLRGVRLIPQRQGVVLVHMDCRMCSRWREKLLLPGERWRYGGGLPEFSAKPGSERSGLSRPDYVNELNRRLIEGIDWAEVS